MAFLAEQGRPSTLWLIIVNLMQTKAKGENLEQLEITNEHEKCFLNTEDPPATKKQSE